jgi:hypothetical protein
VLPVTGGTLLSVTVFVEEPQPASNAAARSAGSISAIRERGLLLMTPMVFAAASI